MRSLKEEECYLTMASKKDTMLRHLVLRVWCLLYWLSN